MNSFGSLFISEDKSHTTSTLQSNHTFEVKSKRYIYTLVIIASLGWFTQSYQLMILNTSYK